MKMKIKKLLGIILFVMLFTGSLAQVFAITPHMDTSWVPEIPEITIDESFLEDNPVDFSLIGTPVITHASYHHGVPTFIKSHLRIQWVKTENACSYEIEIIRPDKTSRIYKTTGNFLIIFRYEDEFVSKCMYGSIVKIRSINGDGVSGSWSEMVSISV